MTRDLFLLDSDQLTLLLAFEKSNGLNQLAEVMAKDPSVISRGLQRIAEIYPVLIKVRGRWELTPLGRQMNLITIEIINQQREFLGNSKQELKVNISENSILIIINAQSGLLDSTQIGRNNSDAEKNIVTLLNSWRKKNILLYMLNMFQTGPTQFSIVYRKGVISFPD